MTEKWLYVVSLRRDTVTTLFIGDFAMQIVFSGEMPRHFWPYGFAIKVVRGLDRRK